MKSSDMKKKLSFSMKAASTSSITKEDIADTKLSTKDDSSIRHTATLDESLAKRELILAAAKELVKNGAVRDLSTENGNLMDDDESDLFDKDINFLTKRNRAKVKAHKIGARLTRSEGGASSSSEDEAVGGSERMMQGGRFSLRGFAENSYRKVKFNGSGNSSQEVSFVDDIYYDGPERRSLERSSSSQISMDLNACISTIETLLDKNGTHYLTSEQRAAIRQLRTASYLHDASQFRKYQEEFGKPANSSSLNKQAVSRIRHRHTMRESIITKEMQESLDEIRLKQQDEDQRQSSHDVLVNYGGMMFENVKYLFKSKRKHKIKAKKLKKKRGGHELGVVVSGKAFVNDEVEEPENTFVRPRVNTIVRKASQISEDSLDESVNGIDNLELNDLNSTTELDAPPSTTPQWNCPPEWTALSPEAKIELAKVLSWENLSRWNFNILEVTKVLENGEHFCPLLLVGWAIICSPSAQSAMLSSISDSSHEESTEEKKADNNEIQYCFESQIDVNPEKVCNFLREIEKRYCSDNAYHNNIHAADVTQTLHALLQFLGESNLNSIYEPIDIFSILLAATFHDVAHPGTNNLFQQNALTLPAIQFNNVSVLESMHSAIGQSFLLGEDKNEEWDIFDGWTLQQIQHARKVMLNAVLGTDMSKHFAGLEELDERVKGVQALYSEMNEAEDKKDEGCDANPSTQQILDILAQTLGASPRDSCSSDSVSEQVAKLRQECEHLAQYILKVLLHTADISNPAKPTDLAKYWAECCLAEFFAQGDREDELNLPISPLCDRQTVKKADSQISFLQFVIQPAFVLVGDVVPRVKTDVIPLVEWNLKYWRRMKMRLSSTNGIPLLTEAEREGFQDDEEDEDEEQG